MTASVTASSTPLAGAPASARTSIDYREQGLRYKEQLLKLEKTADFASARSVAVTRKGYLGDGATRLTQSTNTVQQARLIDAKLTALIAEHGSEMGNLDGMLAAHKALARSVSLNGQASTVTSKARALVRTARERSTVARARSAAAVEAAQQGKHELARTNMHAATAALEDAKTAANRIPKIDLSAPMRYELAHGGSTSKANSVMTLVHDTSELVAKRQKKVASSSSAGIRRRVLDIARGEIGVHEVGGEDQGPRIDMYRRSVRGNDGSGPWCADFVSWVYNRIGHPLVDNNGDPWTVHIADWAKRQGTWHAQGTYRPKPGDLIFFRYSGGNPYYVNHVGIVESIKDGKVHTIEGNFGDQVQRNTFSLGYAPIVGYVDTV